MNFIFLLLLLIYGHTAFTQDDDNKADDDEDRLCNMTGNSKFELRIRNLTAEDIENLSLQTEAAITGACGPLDNICVVDYYHLPVERILRKRCGKECIFLMSLYSVEADRGVTCNSKFPFPMDNFTIFQDLFIVQ